jgi:exopolyphosphatase/pppGpp-phosphohydrolase
MEISRADTPPLTSEEQDLVAMIRRHIDARLLEGGLTADDVHQLQRQLQDHPHATEAVIDAITEEARRVLPGGTLFNLRWE